MLLKSSLASLLNVCRRRGGTILTWTSVFIRCFLEFAVIHNEVIAVFGGKISPLRHQYTSKTAMTELGLSWWHMTAGHIAGFSRNEMRSVTFV